MSLVAPSGPTIRTAAVPRIDEVRAADTAIVGVQAAYLGELAAAGFTVPPGFVVPAPAYLDALEAAGVRADVADTHRRAVLTEDADERGRLCAELAGLVRAAGMPEGLPDAIRAAYGALADPGDPRAAAVVVRPSASGTTPRTP